MTSYGSAGGWYTFSSITGMSQWQYAVEVYTSACHKEILFNKKKALISACV